MQENFGWTKLAKYTRAESFDEMRHAEMLTDRILFLDGLPNYQRLFHVRVGQTVTEMFQADRQVEVEAIDRLKRGIEVMRAKGDITSANIFEDDPRGRGAPHRLPRHPAGAGREARRGALHRPADRAAGAELTRPDARLRQPGGSGVGRRATRPRPRSAPARQRRARPAPAARGAGRRPGRAAPGYGVRRSRSPCPPCRRRRSGGGAGARVRVLADLLLGDAEAGADVHAVHLPAGSIVDAVRSSVRLT